MSKKPAKADAKADTKSVDDSESELMLDSKTMDVLTEKIISAIMPTFQLMLKAAIAELRQEIKLEMDDKMKTLCAEKVDLRCGRMEENFKKLSSENSALRNQLLVLESSQSRTSLLIHGMPENTETTQQPGQDRSAYDTTAILEMANKRLNLDLVLTDISEVYRIPTKVTGPRPIIIQFVTKRVRDKVYYTRMKLNDSAAPNQNRIYINELLSKSTETLFAKVRQRVKDGLFAKAWTANGIIRVVLANDPQARPRKLYTDGDFKELLLVDGQG